MTKYELTVQTVDNSYTYNYETDLEAIIDAYAFERGDMVPDESKNEEILSMKVVEIVAPGGMVGEIKPIYEYRLYTTYAEDTDITFIMTDEIKFGKCVTKVVGFVYGGLFVEDMHKHIGELSAKYNV